MVYMLITPLNQITEDNQRLNTLWPWCFGMSEELSLRVKGWNKRNTIIKHYSISFTKISQIQNGLATPLLIKRFYMNFCKYWACLKYKRNTDKWIQLSKCDAKITAGISFVWVTGKIRHMKQWLLHSFKFRAVRREIENYAITDVSL